MFLLSYDAVQHDLPLADLGCDIATNLEILGLRYFSSRGILGELLDSAIPVVYVIGTFRVRSNDGFLSIALRTEQRFFNTSPFLSY